MKSIFPKKIAFLIAMNLLGAACSEARSSNANDVEPTDDPVQDFANVPNDENEIPCPPRVVLQKTCQECHARPLKNDAPFPLERRSDILRRGRNGATIRELVIAQLEARKMPLSPVTLDDVSRETLLAWVRTGAPSVAPRACVDTEVEADSMNSEERRTR